MLTDKLISLLENKPKNVEMTFRELLAELDVQVSVNELFKIYSEMWDAAQKNGIHLRTPERFEGMIIGMPYDIPFVITD